MEEKRAKEREEDKEEWRAIREKERKEDKEELIKVIDKCIEEKISDAVGPLEEKTESLKVAQGRVQEQVDMLANELSDLKGKKDQHSANDNFESLQQVGRQVQVQQPGQVQTVPVVGGGQGTDLQQVVSEARRTVGLHRIDQADLTRMRQEQFGGAKTVEEEKILAVKEYLKLELKIDTSSIERMGMEKTFYLNSENPECLFVTFKHRSSVSKIYEKTYIMRKESRVRTYIPRQFRDRARAISEIEYEMREVDKCKTKIKMGLKDLQLYKKVGRGARRELVELPEAELPPVDLGSGSPSRQVTTSPAPGRPQQSRPDKRGRDSMGSNKPEKLSSVQTYFTGISDHKLVKFTRFSKSFRPRPRFIRKRMFKNFDSTKYKEALAASYLEEVLAITNIDEASELLVYKITKVLDMMAPVRTVQSRANYAPWLSKATKDLQNRRNAAQRTAAQTDSPDDWREFRSLRNQVTAKLRADKREWERGKLNDKENTSTEIWAKVKSWLGWGGGGTPTQIFNDGQLITSPAGLSNCMNKFFVNKIKRLRESIPATLRDPLANMREAMGTRMCTFHIQEISEADLKKVIYGLKNSAATGVDNIGTKIVKLSAELIAPMLTHIVNLSIRTSTFPSAWKYAKVIPLLKSTDSDPLLPKSYRPVALLPVLSKILEKIVFNQLVSYLEENQLVHPNLHGSRPGHNTATALVQLYDMWAEEIENGKMVGVLVCDQSAAFDI